MILEIIFFIISQEFKHLINSAEYVVDAYVVVLNEIVGAKEVFSSISA